MNMSLPTRVEWFVAVYIVAAGLSLLLRPGLWLAFMKGYKKREDKGILFGFGALIFGLAVVLMHNIWVLDLSVIITVLGWMALVKGFLLLMIPEPLIRMGDTICRSKGVLQIAGLFYALLGAVLIFWLLTRT